MDQFEVDVRPPGYRTFELRPDGTMVTEVVWVEQERAAGTPPRSSNISAA